MSVEPAGRAVAVVVPRETDWANRAFKAICTFPTTLATWAISEFHVELLS